MSRSFNVPSLNMVRPELSRLLEKARGSFEASQQAGGGTQDIGPCLELLQQARGTLRFIELADAAELTAAVLQAVQSNPQLSAESVRHGFVLLLRYLDYLSAHRQAAPELLIEHINTLRAESGLPALQESHFAPRFPLDCRCPGVQLPAAADSAELLRKLRHMYQIGLLGMIKRGGDSASFDLMQRAAQRTLRLIGGGADAEFWWLLCAVLEGFAGGELRVSLERNRLLSRADKRFRDLAASSMKASPTVDGAQKSHLLYLIAKCRRGKRIAAVRAAYELDSMPVSTDQGIDEDRLLLQGPTRDAIDVLIGNVREQLNSVKQLLDQAPASEDTHAIAELPASLARVVPALREADLQAAADVLEQQSASVESALQSADGSAHDQLAGVAEAVLFVESALDALFKSKGMNRASREQSTADMPKVASRGALDDARLTLLSGARDAVEAVKRSVSGFVQAQYNPQQLDGAEEQLGRVKGALAILDHHRAADIASLSGAAVKQMMRAPDLAESAREEIVESFADVLVCLDYYMAALANDETPDHAMLRLAEESLADLHTRATGV
jgi:hypothetical protein